LPERFADRAEHAQGRRRWWRRDDLDLKAEGRVAPEIGAGIIGTPSPDRPVVVGANGVPGLRGDAVAGSRAQRERVTIEFEYVVVCWQHDGPECPVGVVELKSEMDRLSD
jgi:hypothetical protein